MRTVLVDLVLGLFGLWMVIIDMTSGPVQELYLPAVQVVPPRGPCGKDRVAIVNVLPDGSVVVNRERLVEPGSNDDSLLQEYMGQKENRMRQRFHEPGGVRLPDNPILIRADRTVPFEDVERVLRAMRTVGIWRVQFGVVQER